MHLFSIQNEFLKVNILNFGATVQEVLFKDHDGDFKEMVLGYEDLSQYKDQSEFFGATCGRFANRIGKGKFTLNGKEYTLATNNNGNHLHGGNHGFMFRFFKVVEQSQDKIKLYYQSQDGEEGYPGTLDLYVTYSIAGQTLCVEYEATSDKDTLFNPTNHSYFNLSGKMCSIENHYIKIKSDTFAPVDENGLVMHELNKVDDTPFDLREWRKIGDQFNTLNLQLRYAKGFDHPFYVEGLKDPVKLYCKESGIQLTVNTTQPYVHVYSGNYLFQAGYMHGATLRERFGICFESEFMPDDINFMDKPRSILRAGETFQSKSTFTFENTNIDL